MEITIGLKCIYCDYFGNLKDLEIDHSLPLSRFGSNFPRNLRKYDVGRRCCLEDYLLAQGKFWIGGREVKHG